MTNEYLFDPMKEMTMEEVDALPSVKDIADGSIKYQSTTIRLTLLRSLHGEPRRMRIETQDPADPDAGWGEPLYYEPRGQQPPVRSFALSGVPRGFLVHVTGDDTASKPTAEASREQNKSAFQLRSPRSAKSWGTLRFAADHPPAREWVPAQGKSIAVETHVIVNVPTSLDLQANGLTEGRLFVKNVHGVDIKVAKKAELELDSISNLRLDVEHGAHIGIVSGDGVVTLRTPKSTMVFHGPFDTFRIQRQEATGKLGAWGWCGSLEGRIQGFVTDGLHVNEPSPDVPTQPEADDRPATRTGRVRSRRAAAESSSLGKELSPPVFVGGNTAVQELLPLEW